MNAVERDTLKPKKKESMYRKLGFIYTEEVLVVVLLRSLPSCLPGTPRAAKAPRHAGICAVTLVTRSYVFSMGPVNYLNTCTMMEIND